MEKIVRMQIGLMGGVNTNELQEQGEPCFYITPPTLFLSPFHFQLETKLRRPSYSSHGHFTRYEILFTIYNLQTRAAATLLCSYLINDNSNMQDMKKTTKQIVM